MYPIKDPFFFDLNIWIFSLVGHTKKESGEKRSKTSRHCFDDGILSPSAFSPQSRHAGVVVVFTPRRCYHRGTEEARKVSTEATTWLSFTISLHSGLVRSTFLSPTMSR